MASIARDQNGTRRILFVAPDGRRPTIRLGRVSQRAAEAVKFRVEQLLAAKLTGHAIEADTARWLHELEPALADKLARVGLIPSRTPPEAATLLAFLTAYVDGRADLKPSTKTVRHLVIQDLTRFFGVDRDLRSISPGHADDFKQWLVGRGLASTTIHKRLQVARSFFHAMRRHKVVEENPFDGVHAAAAHAKDRQRFISRDDVQRVIDACPDHHWRTIVALARYGGLRCPSEVLSLKWADIDWAANRILIHSPKTEHHAGKASRKAPLFAELRPFLAEAFDLAADGTIYVVDERFRQAATGPNGWVNANLRTTFGKIVRRAGLEPWPRLFHNLRASRETELVETFPVQVVTDWLGNTPSVAMRHYLMTTDQHFEAAVRGSAEAAQNAAQQALAGGRNERQSILARSEKTLDFPVFATSCDIVQNTQVVREGFEPPTKGL